MLRAACAVWACAGLTFQAKKSCVRERAGSKALPAAWQAWLGGWTPTSVSRPVAHERCAHVDSHDRTPARRDGATGGHHCMGGVGGAHAATRQNVLVLEHGIRATCIWARATEASSTRALTTLSASASATTACTSSTTSIYMIYSRWVVSTHTHPKTPKP